MTTRDFEIQNICFETYQNESYSTLGYEELFANKRILVCSMPRYMEFLDHNYVYYLRSCRTKWQDLGVDDVFIINSWSIWCLSVFSAYWKDLAGFYDKNKNFLKWIRHHMNRDDDLDYLAKHWKYQVLINNGKIELFNEYPYIDFHKQLLKKFKIDPDYKQLLQDKDPEIICELKGIFSNPEKYFVNRQHYSCIHTTKLAQKVFYMNIWPNVELEKYLNNLQ